MSLDPLGKWRFTLTNSFGDGPNPAPMPSSFQPAFTEISGLGSVLKSLAPTTTDAGRILQGTVGGQLKSYQVRTGTDAEDLPGIVHPSNYNAVTNAVIFVQI